MIGYFLYIGRVPLLLMVGLYEALIVGIAELFSVGSQNLMGAVVSFDYYCAHQRLPLPIAKGHTLRWIGITKEGVSVLYQFIYVLLALFKFIFATGSRCL
jgi:hypothetical protein